MYERRNVKHVKTKPKKKVQKVVKTYAIIYKTTFLELAGGMFEGTEKLKYWRDKAKNRFDVKRVECKITYTI